MAGLSLSGSGIAVAMRPRYSVSVGGVVLPYVSRLTIRKTRLMECATFSVTASLTTAQAVAAVDISDQSARAGKTIPVVVSAGNLPNGSPEGSAGLAVVFHGVVDSVSFDPIAKIAVVSGRDNSSALANLELSESTFLNMSASQAVQSLAARVGLAADVDATSGLIGQFYQYEHKTYGLAGGHRFRTAWDLCVGLASDYGRSLYTDGNTLYFKTQDQRPALALHASPPSAQTPAGSCDISDVRLTRGLIQSGPVFVTVRAWDARQRTAHVATYPVGSPPDEALRYTFTAPVGTTLDQCTTRALARYNEITGHARTLSGTVSPGMSLTPGDRVQLFGTGTTFDAVYYTVDEVTDEYSMSGSGQSSATRRFVARNRLDIQN